MRRFEARVIAVALSVSASCAGPGEHQGLVYPTTPDRSPLVRVELRGLPPDASTLTGESFVVYSALGRIAADGTLEDDWDEGRALATSPFLYRPTWTHEDPAAEVSAYYHAMRYLEHYERLGFAGFAAPLHLAVNYRPGGDGDFLAGATDIRGGPGIVVGQWGDRNLAYDSDVLGHEIFHVVHASLTPDGEHEVENELDAVGMNTTPMAVAEAVADYFSCTLAGDPDVGEYTAEALGLPYLSTLANERTFPSGRTGQSHADGQVLSGALWEVRALVGATVLDRAVWDTLVAMPGAVRRAHRTGERAFSFPFVVGRLLEHLSTRVDPQVLDEASAVFGARGLAEPSFLVALAPGTPHALWLPAREDGYGNVGSRPEGLPTPLQLFLDVPADANSLHIVIEIERDDGWVPAPESLTVHGRAGAPVRWYVEGGSLTAEEDWSLHPVGEPIILEEPFLRPLRSRALYLSLTNAEGEDRDARVTALLGNGE